MYETSLGGGDRPSPSVDAAHCAGVPSHGPVGRGSLGVLECLTGVAALVRDEELRLVWCNDAYARLSKRPKDGLIGSRIGDFIPKAAAEERAAVLERVLRTGRTEAYYQFAADKRLLCRVFACDPASFGHGGVLVVVLEAPVGTALASEERLSVMSTPLLDELDALSPAELRVLYHLALGRSTADIAESLCRATKTVEKHIESVHRKLGTSSRAGIVRLATERGLQAFTQDEWESIIRGVKALRAR
jgi:DNA-binding CsgD family transcriptional regulator